MYFDGDTYDAKRDKSRLSGQCLAVFALMKDGRWRTLGQIAFAIRSPEASVSARLRDMRKARFGGHAVERRSLGGGLFSYRLRVNKVGQLSLPF